MAERCEFCDATAKLQKAMALIEEIPELGEPLFDDPLSDAFHALEDAASVWRCWVHNSDGSLKSEYAEAAE